MELKKSPNVDLEKDKSIYFQVGLAATLLAFCGIFWVSVSSKEAPKMVQEEQVVEATEIVEIIKPEEVKEKKDMPKQTVKVMSDILKIVEDDAKIINELDFFAEPDENMVVQPIDYGGSAEGVLADEDAPFVSVEEMPKFQGGDFSKFSKWVQKNCQYPVMAQETGIQGSVLVQLVVEKDGSVSVVEVLKSPDKLLTDEALRVIKKSPKFTPGKQRGVPVRVQFVLPVRFKL
ncbi:MAG: energy transducer TonB [Rikenellaceae bacterium]|nr:energy transducer TonB [Rikenellaceae bacterium]